MFRLKYLAKPEETDLGNVPKIGCKGSDCGWPVSVYLGEAAR